MDVLIIVTGLLRGGPPFTRYIKRGALVFESHPKKVGRVVKFWVVNKYAEGKRAVRSRDIRQKKPSKSTRIAIVYQVLTMSEVLFAKLVSSEL
jgi:hypothetical protein